MKIKSYRYINIVEIPEDDKYNLIPFINKITTFIDDHNKYAEYKSDKIDKRDLINYCDIDYHLNNLRLTLCYEKFNGKQYLNDWVEFHTPLPRSEFVSCKIELLNRLKEYSLKQYWHDEIEEDSLDI